MKKIFAIMMLALCAALFSASAVFAGGEIDILVNKLVEKGVLTPLEAQIVLDETKVEVAQSIAKQEFLTLPSWVQKLKLKGDLRLRYQYERRAKEIQSRSRGRVRYRLSLGAQINERLKVAAGLASGGDDGRSTNQSFEDAFDTPDIRLDFAYVEWKPDTWISLVGGKFGRKAYLWNPTDVFWDGDINPEGGSIHMENKLTANTDWFLNTGVWVLEELNSGNTAINEAGTEDHVDPFLNYVQGGLKWKEGDFDATVASIYYGFHGVQGIDFQGSRDTNTKFGTTYLRHDYDAFGFSGEVGVKKPFDLPFKRAAIFGDYVKNVDPEDQNTGWAIGAKVGDKKVSKKGQWQAKYQYAWVERDAFLDIFPDSDRKGGDTNVKGHEGILQYGLNDNVILGFDYYYSDRIKNAGDTTSEHLIQSDIVFKF